MNVQSNNGKITAPTFSANAELSNDARKSFVLRGTQTEMDGRKSKQSYRNLFKD